MELYNLENGERVAGQVEVASSFLRRLRGLMMTDELPKDSALHIQPCRSVHTFFMRYPIDVLYLDDNGVIVGMDEGLEPGRIGSMVAQARSVVELPAGQIRETESRIGHATRFVEKTTNNTKEIG